LKHETQNPELGTHENEHAHHPHTGRDCVSRNCSPDRSRAFLAWLVDAFVILGLVVVLSIGFAFAWLPEPGSRQAMNVLGYFVLSIGYGVFCEWKWRGQTLGKRFLRLRVVDAEGLKLQFNQIVTRNLLRFIDSLPFFYFVGGRDLLVQSQMPAARRHCGPIQSSSARPKSPSRTSISCSPANTTRSGRIRISRRDCGQRVSPTEAAIALQAVMRRDTFEPAARVELFAELATHFRAKSRIPC